MEPEPPGEFDMSLRRIAVGVAPDGIGETFFDEPPSIEEMETAAGEGDPSMVFRRTLGMFATGVTVITVRAGEVMHGMTANAFMSVSLRPPLILISIDRRAKMNALLREGVRYGVSVLEERQVRLSDQFAGRAAEGDDEPEFEIVRETPLVAGALAHLVARVVRSYWGGDHSLILGQVEYVRYGEGTPLLFHGGRYERVGRESRIIAPEELHTTMLKVGTERSFEAGERLMTIGEPGESLYLILEGTVQMRRPGRSIALGPGELVGEIEVLAPGQGRIADISAETAVRAVEVPREALVGALEAHPRAAIALIGVLASRFRDEA
jgi:flavin reductase (DIM6/NTAB) family NADH-FMN oxidoreductase RutF